jgi:thioredoxin reductase
MAEEQKADQSQRVKIYGRPGSAAAYAIRDFLQRSDVPFEWIELKDDINGEQDSREAKLPVCVFPDGTRLEGPTIRQIVEKLGWFHDPSRSEYDLAICGAGPAGLSAAVYGASEGLKTVVVERWAVGGQAGSSPKIENYLGFPRGYGAGASEASFCVGDHVYLVGGGNSAAQAAIHFSAVASKVTMIVRDDTLKQTVSAYLVDRIRSTKNIEVLTNTEVIELIGNHYLEAIKLRNHKTGEERTVKTRWLFVCIGGAPHTEWAVEAGVCRDQAGYLLSGPDLMPHGQKPENWPLDRNPYDLETNVPGLFAAGDVRHGSVKRCASAVGEGAMAVTFVHRYLEQG